jgi:multicomponent Na+:H+ antiporter subunit E
MPFRQRALTFVIAAAGFALVWLALARGGPGGLAAGAIALGAALWTWGRIAIAPRTRLRWLRLPVFAALFVRESLRGGVDVARRIVSPDMRLRPGLITMTLTLPGEGPRVLLALVVSLLPGTLAVRLEGDRLTLHALDVGSPVQSELRRIEDAIARLFGAGAAAQPPR